MTRGQRSAQWHGLPKELVAALNMLGRAAATEIRREKLAPELMHRLAHRACAQAFREAQRITRAAYGVQLSREETSHE